LNKNLQKRGSVIKGERWL